MISSVRDRILQPYVKLSPLLVTPAAAKVLKRKAASVRRRLFDAPQSNQDTVKIITPELLARPGLNSPVRSDRNNTTTNNVGTSSQFQLPVEPRRDLRNLNSLERNDEHNITNNITNSIPTRTKFKLPAELGQYESLLPEWNRCLYEEEVEETVKSATNGRKSRKSFCPYCKKNIIQLPRHLETVHKNEELVSKLTGLSKGNNERNKILRVMRLWGTYIYNNCRSYNKGILKVYQRPRGGVERVGADYIPCANCGVLIFKRRYGRHYDKCKEIFKLGYRSKEAVVAGRSLNTCLHRNANLILRERIFPILRVDDCIKAIRFDKAVIAYGNNIALRYSMSPHHDKMIRANLRMLGRLLVICKSICKDVTDFASLLVPSRADLVRDAINKVAELEETTGTYAHPASASQGAFATKQLTLVWKTECIKMEDYNSEKKVDRFLSILETQIIPMVDKLVTENRTRAQRKKKVVMPTIKDIEILNSFLIRGYTDCVDKLKSQFNYDIWKMLGSYGLVALLVYNKRRPGEMDRILLENFKSLMKLDNSHDLYSTFTEEEKTLATRNMLFVIRGKLNRTVSVFVSPSLKHCLDLFVSLRGQAGVSSSNPYLFGLPGANSNTYKYLNSCALLRLFAKQCNARDPTTLRATVLRKGLATMAASLQLPETVTKELADHMGHDISIHKNIYRQVTYQKSVLNVASALEKAIGGQQTNNTAGADMPPDIFDIPSSSFSAEAEIPAPTTSNARSANNASNVKTNITKRKSQNNQYINQLNKLKGRELGTDRTSSLSEEEKRIIRKAYFKEKRKLNRSPIATDLEATMKLPEMKNASLPNVMMYLDNMKRKPRTPKKQRYVDSPHKIVQSPQSIRKRNSAHRKPWTQASLDLLEKLFDKYINGDSTRMPSKSEIELVIEKHKVLAGRTAAVVKTCLHNMRKRR